MTKVHKITLISLLLVSLIILGYFVTKGDIKQSAQTNNTTQNTASTDAEPLKNTSDQTEVSTSAGRYIDYSEEALANSNSTNILFFHAPWCPQCRALDKSVKEANLPDNVTVFKVDYDSNQALRRKYDVTIQTTLVRLDQSGQLAKKFVAYDDPSWEAASKEIL